MIRIFLHGLDSSGQGTKGRFFAEHFPDMLRPDFSGTLDERMMQLENVLERHSDIILVGSSYGGLMAALYALRHPERVRRMVLLAPALNYEGFAGLKAGPFDVPVFLYVGSKDDVTPVRLVVPAAQRIFSHCSVFEVDDDHLLHKTFSTIDWQEMLA